MSKNQPTSRLVKHQREAMMKQSFFWIIISGLLLLFFLFFIVPNAPRLLAVFIDSSTSFGQEDTIPPQVPVFNSPPSATNLSELTVSGFGEANSQLVVVVNGNIALEEAIGEDGSFSHLIVLNEGDNVIQAYAIDTAQNESALSKEFSVLVDTEIPTLTLEKDLSEISEIVGKDNRMLTLSGATEPLAKVQINDRFVFARSDGTFSYQLQLNEGENPIVFIITDKAGNEFRQEYKLVYKP